MDGMDHGTSPPLTTKIVAIAAALVLVVGLATVVGLRSRTGAVPTELAAGSDTATPAASAVPALPAEPTTTAAPPASTPPGSGAPAIQFGAGAVPAHSTTTTRPVPTTTPSHGGAAAASPTDTPADAPAAPPADPAAGAPPTTTDPRAFDGQVTFDVVPETTHVTLNDIAYFDATIHNGTNDTISPQIQTKFDSDASMPAHGWLVWNGTVEEAERAIDLHSAITTNSFAVGADVPADWALFRSTPTVVPAGTTVHLRLAWEAQLSEAPFADTDVSAWSWLGWSPRDGEPYRWADAASGHWTIRVDADQGLATSRHEALAAAFADPRVQSPLAEARAADGSDVFARWSVGAWYHAGTWSVIIAAPFINTSRLWTVRVDAANATVIDVTPGSYSS